MSKKDTLKLIIKMSIPPAISMLIQSLYNIIDSIYITKFDPSAMEALSIVFPIQNIILAIGVGIGIGINAYVSIKLGQKRKSEAENAATLGVLASCVHYILVVIIGLLLCKPFIKSFTSDAKVIDYALLYIRLMIITSFNVVIQISFEKILQADGKMSLPMYALFVGALLNIVLDPIFIFVCDMGVLGAAIATIIGQLTATIMMLCFTFSKKNTIRLSLKKLKWDPQALKAIYKVGIPSVLITGIPSIMVSVMNLILIGISTTAVTTFGIYYKIQNFVYMAVCGICQGVMPVISYNYGARNKNQFNLVVKESLLLSAGLGLFFNILFLIIPGPLMKLFYSDAAMINSTKVFLQIASFSFILGSFNYVLGGYFQAIQKGFKSLLVNILRQFIFLLPLAYLFGYLLGEKGVYLGLVISETLTFIFAFIFYMDSKKKLNRYFDENNVDEDNIE